VPSLSQVCLKSPALSPVQRAKLPCRSPATLQRIAPETPFEGISSAPSHLNAAASRIAPHRSGRSRVRQRTEWGWVLPSLAMRPVRRRANSGTRLPRRSAILSPPMAIARHDRETTTRGTAHIRPCWHEPGRACAAGSQGPARSLSRCVRENASPRRTIRARTITALELPRIREQRYPFVWVIFETGWRQRGPFRRAAGAATEQEMQDD
jgi:hypothetical protein